MTVFLEVIASFDGEFFEHLTLTTGDYTGPKASIDLSSARFNFDIGENLDRKTLQRLYDDPRRFGARDLKTVLVDKITEESGVRFNRQRLQVYYGSTRHALSNLLSILSEDKNVLTPIPSWHFWSLEIKSQGNFGFFPGYSPGEVVRRFGTLAQRDDSKVLLLVSPSNPLGYEFTEAQCREIDDIALRNGVEIVVDDVLLGTNPVDQRLSIARYFTKPFMVSGLSKRFGDIPLGSISYVVVPEGEQRDFASSPPPKKQSLMDGGCTDLAFKHCSDKALRALQDRNAAFDEGFTRYAPDEVTIQRPSSTFINTFVYVPQELDIDALDIERRALARGIAIRPMHDFFPSDLVDKALYRPFKGHFRVTTAQVTVDQSCQAGLELGYLLREMI